MAEKEVSFLTDRSIGGRFKRALAVALPSIALARKDPYLVKALYDKEEEFGKLDRQDASDLIKTTASSITDLITKNKATRKSRVNSNFESLTALKGKFPELENADIALIQKRGLGGTLENIKLLSDPKILRSIALNKSDINKFVKHIVSRATESIGGIGYI